MSDNPVDPIYEPGKDTRPLVAGELSEKEVRIIAEIEHRLGEVRAVRPRADRGVTPGYLARTEDRHPRVLLLDGGRGTGKTSVLVTLVRRWNPPACEDYDATLGPRPDFVRVLPILDFDPLPPGMPLAAWIIQAWRPLVDNCDSLRNTIGIDESDGILDRWHQLFRLAAVGWSSIPRETGLIEQVLDREEQVEGWHHLHQQWYDFVDRVLDFDKDTLPHHARLFPPSPVFVIMIDDVDLQVARAPELLPALRLLYHPSVVFVVAADRRHLKDMLRLEFFGRQNELAHQRIEGGELWPIVDRDRWCNSLALSAFEKAFSRRDQWRLTRLSLAEFLKFPSSNTFADVLNERGLPSAAAAADASFDKHGKEPLGDYIGSFASVLEKLTVETPPIMTYRSAQQLADQVLTQPAGARRATMVLRRLLDPEDREDVAVELRRSGDPPIVEYRPVGEVAALFSPDYTEIVLPGRQTIVLSGSPRFRFMSDEREPATEQRARHFPLSQLLAVSLQDTHRRVSAPGLRWESRIALAWTHWRSNGVPEASFRWLLHILPPPLTLLEWAEQWASFIRDLAGEAFQKRDRIAYGWIYHQLQWLGAPVADVPDPKSADLNDEDAWKKLLQKQPSTDDLHPSLGRNRWRRRTLPLLARPELGLTPDVQRRILSVLPPRVSSKELRDERERLIRDAFDAAAAERGSLGESQGRDEDLDVSAVLAAVDKRYPRSPWQQKVGPRAKERDVERLRSGR